MKTELQIAADKLVREIFGVKAGENVVLTAVGQRPGDRGSGNGDYRPNPRFRG